MSMRGIDYQQAGMYSYLSPEERVRRDHPLRAIRVMADLALEKMSERFDAMYAKRGRPSIPPEKLLRSQLIQMLYSVRSERLLMEEIDYSMLFRWFVGMNLDEPVWDVTVFTKNRNRLLEGDVAREFLSEVVHQAREKNLTSDEHFTVDGTLLEACAGVKSFQRRDTPKGPPDDPGNPSVDFHGEQRNNETHQSTTDPDALLARKGSGKEAKLSYNANLLTENRHGLIMNAEVFQANGTAERDAALLMLEQIRGGHRVTVGTDKGYDTFGFVAECRNLKVTAQVAQNTKRSGGSAIDQRTTRHKGYEISQQKRKRIEECFGWMKDIAGAQDEAPGHRKSSVVIHLCRCRLQPGATAETDATPGWCRMSQGRSVPVLGQKGQLSPHLKALICLSSNTCPIHIDSGLIELRNLLENSLISAAC